MYMAINIENNKYIHINSAVNFAWRELNCVNWKFSGLCINNNNK